MATVIHLFYSPVHFALQLTHPPVFHRLAPTHHKYGNRFILLFLTDDGHRMIETCLFMMNKIRKLSFVVSNHSKLKKVAEIGLRKILMHSTLVLTLVLSIISSFVISRKNSSFVIQNKTKSLKLRMFKESLSASRDIYFSFSFSRFPFCFRNYCK